MDRESQKSHDTKRDMQRNMHLRAHTHTYTHHDRRQARLGIFEIEIVFVQLGPRFIHLAQFSRDLDFNHHKCIAALAAFVLLDEYMYGYVLVLVYGCACTSIQASPHVQHSYSCMHVCVCVCTRVCMCV